MASQDASVDNGLMKAVRFHGQHDLRYEDVPIPQVGKDQVKIRLAWVGILRKLAAVTMLTSQHRWLYIDNGPESVERDLKHVQGFEYYNGFAKLNTSLPLIAIGLALEALANWQSPNHPFLTCSWPARRLPPFT